MSVTVEVSLVNAVIARLAADTTLTAIVPATRIDQLRGPIRNLDVSDNLYIVVQPTAMEAEHSQRSDGFKVSFAVMTVDRLANGLSNLGPIGERIYGDANLSVANNGVPTYGLHRHNIVLSDTDRNGWVGNNITSTGVTYDGIDHVNVRTATFEVNVSRVPA